MRIDQPSVRATLLENPRSGARSLPAEPGGGLLAAGSGWSLGAEPGGEPAAEPADPWLRLQRRPPAPPASPERPGVLVVDSRACSLRHSESGGRGGSPGRVSGTGRRSLRGSLPPGSTRSLALVNPRQAPLAGSGRQNADFRGVSPSQPSAVSPPQSRATPPPIDATTTPSDEHARFTTQRSSYFRRRRARRRGRRWRSWAGPARGCARRSTSA